VKRPALAVVLCLAAAACNRGTASPALRLSQPSAVAVFSGFTARHAELWPYVAVGNSGQDELILFDAVSDRVVSAPIVLRPLSIPVNAPRPALLASASFPSADPGAPPRPSLLVVATAGSSALQLVRTWPSGVAGVSGPGLADVDPVELGDEVLALLATPVPAGSADAVEADRLRVVAALAGGRMAIVEFGWTGDAETGSVTVGTTAFADVGFDALSLAVDPRDHRFLYAASLEAIDGVFGVAQIDMLADPASWTPRVIDAHAPTRLVAAFTLRERKLTTAGAYDQNTIPAGFDEANAAFEDDAAPRVYAWRDPSACGPNTSLACGVVVLDPGTGDVLEDPWHRGAVPKRYLPPITLPSRPVALIVGPPAANPPAQDHARPPEQATPAELMLIGPGNAPRLTTGVLVMPSEDGRSYFADLARWETPSGVFELAPGTGAGVSAFRASASNLPRIGLYRPPSLSALGGEDIEVGASAAVYIEVTPGFTPADQWTVTFQGYLPGFASSRTVQVESAGAGLLRVAFQVLPPGSTTLTQVVDVHDPSRGVRVGDIVEFWTDASSGSDTPACPDTTSTQDEVKPIEGKVTAIAPPDLDHPGGSLVVERGDCVPIAEGSRTRCDDQEHGPWNSQGHEACWDQLVGVRVVRLRAGGGAPGSEEFLVVGAGTGYAGRAVATPVNPGSAGPTFELTSVEEDAGTAEDDGVEEDEATLTSQCSALAQEDPAWRTTCERAAIARRARRVHLTSVACYDNPAVTTDTFCETFFPEFVKPANREPPQPADTSFPPPEGPALAFSLGVIDTAPTDPPRIVVRDTRVTFSTRSGWAPASRFGGGGDNGPATLPMGGVYFDRTADPAWDRSEDRYRFFVPYVGNLVLDLSPARSNDNTRVLR
jgi:hypothetical protein